ncbi:uncharacterized protein [Haliotis cracherodii]|uniref:uncharacterized protein n=1 Tax=Haliotis cracherodii TaxID=6455 RepID=UPI0039ECBC3B
MDALWLMSLLYLTHAVMCEDVLFESGKRLIVVDPATVEGGASEYEDPKDTGSKLFNSSQDNNDKKRMSLLVMIYKFRSKSSKYFRAHPVFVSCLQQILNDLQNEDTPAQISSGYKTKTDVGGSTSIQDLYARAGTGAYLKFKDGVNGDVKKIAKAALKHCPVIFERIQRDIGIIMTATGMHIHMTGADDPQPHFSAESGFEMNTASFEAWALASINEGLDPLQSPDCSKFLGLDSGQIHPSDVTTPEELVGVVDQPITRDTPEDFIKLVQYQGSNVVFPNPEGAAGWCGKEDITCVDCTASPAGNHVSKRCANRLMSARMYNFVRVLQKLTRDNISGSKLKVTKAYVEPYAGQTDYSATSLHVEGRQVTLQLDTGATAGLKTVTKLAQCIGVDFIKHNGDHVVLAVRKMKGYKAQKVDFQQAMILAVEPPHSKVGDYSLPEQFDESELDDYPLFDSNGQEDDLLAEDTALGQFTSSDPEFRYLRLNPLITKCYSLLLHQHNKWNAEGDPATDIDVVRGFISTKEQQLTIDPFDQRYNTFILGLAMEVKYNSSQNPNGHTLPQLAQAVVDTCAPVFAEGRQEMGMGLYADRVFVDMRDEFDVWTDNVNLIPHDFGSLGVYKAELKIRFDASKENRIVDPDDIEEAKKSANVPYRQSPLFRHTPPPHVIRRRRAAPDPDDCVPKTDTSFCGKTKQFRDKEIEYIWTEVMRKYHYHDRDEVRQALELCMGQCGTCMEGSVYESKLEHCDNFLHWVPFGLMNDNTISNFFPRDNTELRRYASQEHSIEDAELFHLVISSAEAVFRPDPKQSVEQELYPQAENPSPVMMLLHRLYAIHATGKVKFWVYDDTDISSLREPLQVVMLYNKNVTSVEVYVSSPGSKDAVSAAVENMILEWSTNGYPAVTREFIAPYTLMDLPKYVAKRDVDIAIREDLIERYTNREKRWVNMEL